jgi:hypothetical protein
VLSERELPPLPVLLSRVVPRALPAVLPLQQLVDSFHPVYGLVKMEDYLGNDA